MQVSHPKTAYFFVTWLMRGMAMIFCVRVQSLIIIPLYKLIPFVCLHLVYAQMGLQGMNLSLTLACL